MQKRAYFVILLVAFTGLLFPPMTFAQNSDDSRPLECPDFLEYDGGIYTFDRENHSHLAVLEKQYDIKDGAWTTTCYYTSDVSEETLQFKTNWFTDIGNLNVEAVGYLKGICSNESVVDITSHSISFKSQVVYASVRAAATHTNNPIERTKSIDEMAVSFFDQIYDKAVPCPSPKVKSDIILENPEHSCPTSIQLIKRYALEESSSQKIGTAISTKCHYVDPDGALDEITGFPTKTAVITVVDQTEPVTINRGDITYCSGRITGSYYNPFFIDRETFSYVTISGTNLSQTNINAFDHRPFLNISDKAASCDLAVYAADDKKEKSATIDSPKIESGPPPPSDSKCARESDEVIGKVVGVFRDVWILRDGDWIRASKGMDLYACDVVKTVNDGRARLEFDDRDPTENAGPTVANLGPNTEVAVISFVVRFDKDEVNQEGFFELLEGTIRAYAKGWGQNSIFSVKAGVALCGIRGSDMVFSYDPQQERLSVFANEGEVSVKSETAGNTKTVTAGQSVIVEKGHINPVATMSDFAWQSSVSKTILPETAQASAQELGETQVNEPMEEISPLQDSGGGCLVATAAYGSELAPQVQQLRELRDSKLLQTETGTSFMESFNSFYYSFSPYIADYERENPVFKEAVKLFITPMIASLSILNHVDMDSEAEVLGYGISLIILNLGMYVGIPAFAIISLKKRF